MPVDIFRSSPAPVAAGADRAKLIAPVLLPIPPVLGMFQFAVLASLRAAQLMRGCIPRVGGEHKPTVIARLEVAEGWVLQAPSLPHAPAVSPSARDLVPADIRPASASVPASV